LEKSGGYSRLVFEASLSFFLFFLGVKFDFVLVRLRGGDGGEDDEERRTMDDER